MAKIDTKKATTDPVNSTIHSKDENANPALSSFKALAPNIVGTARKNENSAATNLEVPNMTAPIIVEPDLDVPGINANI